MWSAASLLLFDGPRPQRGALHRRLAETAGIPFHEVLLPSLAIDVDERADIDAILRTGVGRHTRRVLEELR